MQFDSTLRFNDKHELYRPITDPAYVGTPSAEIDANWEQLVGGKDFLIEW